ncbi:MAG: thioesterase family protein [Armatimonadota bacterium]|nr:thioesterase family protein [Armatimonadota bacterium]MDR5676508.1 thioesterase family protein [Armatimonadota bacterium]MDR5689530.1 thioesterase family protein [Armatimonadota bacterium]MDR7387896.1 thioesterase family protein [Armatimonadota bacterium]MDR7389184.1 thioesterase family protein [Armatimonadota bacterium]
MQVTLPVEVRYAETDQMGVVHHAVYVVWMEAARVEFLKRLGTPYHELERSGIRLPVVELGVTYRAPASFGQVVAVSCQLSGLASRAVSFRYAVELDGRLLAEGYTRHVCCDLNGQAMPLPETLRQVLEGARAPRSGGQRERPVLRAPGTVE